MMLMQYMYLEAEVSLIGTFVLAMVVKAKAIFDSFHVSEGYQYTNSFLQSILDVMPNVTQTLLREHYRCHPKIINFCNQKFYRGELIIMTTDKGEEDVLSVVKTVAGNHERNHYSQIGRAHV